MPGGSEWIFQGEPAGRTLEYPFTATWHGMDIHMILGEAWNVIPSKCQLEYRFTDTWHGMDIHMILSEAWNVIPSKCQKFVPTASVVVVEVGVVVVRSSCSNSRS